MPPAAATAITVWFKCSLPPNNTNPLLCGLIAGTGALFISYASKILESSVFAPLQYSQLIAGFIFGYLFFSDIPDIFEIVGSLIISISGLFIIYREYKVGLRPVKRNEIPLRDVINRGQ